MLRDSKWTLQVRKPVTKKSICHWVWLSFAGKKTFGQLWSKERLPENWAYLQEKASQGQKLDQQWGRRRVGLPWECEPTARGVRSEDCPYRLHQPQNAPSWCFDRRAPCSVPNTAPNPPPTPGFDCPSGARKHTVTALLFQFLGCGTVESWKSSDVKQVQPKKRKQSARAPSEKGQLP